MKHVGIHDLAARQHNRFSRKQLEELGMSTKAIRHSVTSGRIIRVAEGVFALPPIVDDDKATWMAATLRAPESCINRLSAACAFDVLSRRPKIESVVRPGSGGPRYRDGIVIYRSSMLEGETTELEGIPITTMPRTLLDLACFVSDRALARALREAIRLNHTTMRELGDHLGRFRGRHGSTRLALVIARYKKLPLERARSGVEIRALEILSEANRPMPRLNVYVAGEEADLSWPDEKLIIEIDGGPFHLDKGEDARKEAAWRGAGWQVERTPSDDVYENPALLLDLAPRVNVHQMPL